jgi:WD40 repeat protein
MEQHLNIIPFDLSDRQFKFRPHYKNDIMIMTGKVSPNGKLIAYAVHTKDNSSFHEKYVILIKNILEDYIHSVIYANYLINEIYDFSFVKLISWHPSSKWLVYVEECYRKFSNIIMIWNTETNNFDAQFNFDFKYNNLSDPIPINYLQWIDNGTKLLVSFENRNITIIDILTFQILKKIDLNRKFISIGHLFSNYVLIFNTRSVLATNQLSLQLWNCNLKDDSELKSILLENDINIITSFSLSPNKSIIACGSSSNHINLYNIENLLNCELTDIADNLTFPIAKKLNKIGGSGFFGTEWAPNGINLISVGYEVCLWNTITGILLQTIRTNYINTICIKSLSFVENYIYIINCSSTDRKSENIVIYDPLVLHKKTILACQLIKYRLSFRLRLPHELWDLIINDFGLSTMI